MRVNPPSSSRERSIVRVGLFKWGIINVLLGMYIIIYIFTIYLYRQTKRKPKHVVMIATTTLFLIIMAQMGLGWFHNDSVFIELGSTRESIYNGIMSNPAAGMYLLKHILFFSGLITVNFLMIWRCYHVWGDSWRIILVPCILLSCECAIFISVIAIVSVHMSGIPLSVTRVLDALEIALYSIPAAICLLCTYLIAHRIVICSRQSDNSRIGATRGRFQKIIDIIVQSSVVYTVTLVCAASTEITKLHMRKTLMPKIIFGFTASLLTPIAGITSTLMVARVGLITARFDGSIVEEESIVNFSGIQFFRSSGARMRTTIPEEERDIIGPYKIKST